MCQLSLPPPLQPCARVFCVFMLIPLLWLAHVRRHSHYFLFAHPSPVLSSPANHVHKLAFPGEEMGAMVTTLASATSERTAIDNDIVVLLRCVCR